MDDRKPWIRPGRPRRAKRTALVLALFALGLCLIGAAGLGLASLQTVQRADDPVRDTADGFLREMIAGDTAAAYGRLCADARTRWSEQGFTAWVRTPPLLAAYQIEKVTVATREGRPHGTVRVQLSRDAGPGQNRELTVIREDDAWRVCGDPW